MNKNGKGLSAGMILLIGVVLVFGWTQNFAGVQDFFGPSGADEVITKCSSSGLTEFTLNAQEALASTATNANVSYLIYEDGVLVKDGDTGSDGTVSIDLGCGVGRTYDAIIYNQQVDDGFYRQDITIDASGPTDTHNVKMYQYGTVDVASVVSSSDPTGAANISSGTGKTCGFTVTLSNNETASGYNKPLLLVLTNTSAVTDVTMDGVTEVPLKRPIRISTIANSQFYTFEYDELLKSTDSAVKLNGKIVFSASASIPTGNVNNLSVQIVDQAEFKKSEYKTLSMEAGLITAAENTDTITDVGGADSNIATVAFAGTYC